MSIIGGPIEAGVAGAPDAQNRANASQSKRRADEAAGRRRFRDEVELRVTQVESDEALHALEEHASDDAESERHPKPRPQFTYHGHVQPTALSAYQQAGLQQSTDIQHQTESEAQNETEETAADSVDENDDDDDAPRRHLDLTG